MSLRDEINAAIASHSIWKAKLSRAIQSGTSDISPDVIQRDDQCAFGKWLVSEKMTPELRASEEYGRVQALHTEFHRVAARVAELAVAGDKQGAEKLMGMNGAYTKTTTQLVVELSAWLQKVT